MGKCIRYRLVSKDPSSNETHDEEETDLYYYDEDSSSSQTNQGNANKLPQDSSTELLSSDSIDTVIAY